MLFGNKLGWLSLFGTMTAPPIASTLTGRLQEMSICRHSYPALLKQDRHAHAYMNITFIVTGSLSEAVGMKSSHF